MDKVVGWLEYQLFSIGSYTLNTYQLVSALLVLVAAMIINKLAARALARAARYRKGMAESQVYTMTRLLGYTIFTIAILLTLSMLGITFDRIALVAGALSVGIGFGLQNIVSNFISGIIILFEKTLRVGDFVELENGLLGEVREINIRSTWIRTLGNEDILVPNSQFISSQVNNWTLSDEYRRFGIEFGVAYGSDPHQVIEAVEAAAREHEVAIKAPDKMPGVIMTGFGDSSLDFKLVIWVEGQMVRKPGLVYSQFLLMIHDVLKAEGVEIPFPQRDIHIRSGLEPVSARPAE